MVLNLINVPLETYALETYPNLTHFLISWFVLKESIGLLLVGPKHEPSTFWKLKLGRMRK
jgi:hypothetical protein